LTEDEWQRWFIFSVLDPRISYEGAKEDYSDDADLLEYLESVKGLLHTHYTEYYANRACSTQETTDAHVQTVTDDSPSKVNFTLRYKKKENLLRDELQEYFKLPREDFDTCQPLQWWVGRQSQFPSLYCLAHDVFSIPGTFSDSLVHIKHWHHLSPGSAVAVECIFSGGHDTISLQRASLQPETIRTLMLVKQRLRLSRLAIDKAL
jgi:hAT family C-terminal dimerisation region